MSTVLRGPRPPDVEEWLRRRQALGQDLFDEVWEGEYHVTPAPHGRAAAVDHQLARVLGPLADRAGLWGLAPCNIGSPGDYRVPDQAYTRDRASLLWYPTAAIVVEVISPGDESRVKLGFYHRAGVEEVILADPEARAVEILARHAGAFRPVPASGLLGVSAADLEASIDWPG